MDKINALLASPEALIPHLTAALKAPLPGVPAQMKMAPLTRALPKIKKDTPPHIAAILAPLYLGPQGLSLLFTLRPETLKHHAGQISFPGGREEDADPSLVYTATRETEEELGIAPQCVNILGKLTPLYISPSHNMVHPFVGWLPTLPSLKPNVREVAKILEIPLSLLLDPSSISTCPWQHEEHSGRAPCYQVYGFPIWGATAMVVSEFLTVLKSVPKDLRSA